MRFIGSKEQLVGFIEAQLTCRVGPGTRTAGDLFCGTAAITRLLKKLGHGVIANDNLYFCHLVAKAALLINEEPPFELLLKHGDIRSGRPHLFAEPYDLVLSYLNDLPGTEGFIFREYSPGGTAKARFRRRYFSDGNARRIDAVRAQIEAWRASRLLTEAEFALLITDLLRAANRVANIAGTYGCFLKNWDKRARRPIVLERSPITPGPAQHEILCMDAHEVARDRSFDIVYLDPPYTWRHYGAYYHVLETIARGDTPVVSGQTGLRPWEESKSRYCNKSQAPRALQELVTSIKCKHLFLSYNSEGLIRHGDIMDILRTCGKPECIQTSHRRYLSNSGGTRAQRVEERLYYVQTL